MTGGKKVITEKNSKHPQALRCSELNLKAGFIHLPLRRTMFSDYS